MFGFAAGETVRCHYWFDPSGPAEPPLLPMMFDARYLLGGNEWTLMETVRHSRDLPHPPEAVREAIHEDLGAFMRASDFDSVRVDGDRIEVSRSIGLATLSLTLVLTSDPDATLAYEQEAGIFERMETRYTVTGTAEGSRVVAETDFTLGGVLGSVLDATVIRAQRQTEFEGQFDYLEDVLGGPD
ncbi:MAG: SRPBCC family protein [Halodesulfurarchaeum sp.]